MKIDYSMLNEELSELLGIGITLQEKERFQIC